MTDVLQGNATASQLAALFCVMRSRGETVDELSGLAQALLEAAVPLDGLAASTRERLVDTCGTGGDRSGTINVSTMAALVVAAAGVPVAKHGNRAASSQTGSADVLEALGVAIDLGAESVVHCIEAANMGFCLAPRFHPGFRHVAPIRRELGVGTAFNFLGPLINPARVVRQVIGVSDPSVAELMLGVLRENGAMHAMVLYGHDGLDELTTTTTSTIHELRDGAVNVYEVDPTKLGISPADPASLRGGAPADNAERVRHILSGEQSPQSEIVALNAAAALVVGGAASNIEEGFAKASEVLASGEAATVLARLAEQSQVEREREDFLRNEAR